MQNIRIGVVMSMSPVGVKSSSSARWPSWKIQTMAPKVALRLSRLRTMAFTGTRTLPNMRNRTTKVTRAMMPAASGSRSRMAALESTSSADGPATSTGKGASRARTSWTRASPSADSGSTDGTTENQVPPPGEANRPEASLGGATWAPSR